MMMLMMRKRLLLLANIFFIGVLLAPSFFTQGVSPEWNVGDIYLWGTQTITHYVEFGVQSEVNVLGEIEYNITGINTLEQEFDAYRTTTAGRTFIHNRDYGAESFINSRLRLSSFISVNYLWDYEYNRTVLQSFSLSLDPFYLIEPDWVKINKGFREMLNGSEIIDTVDDPYSSTVYNFTLQEVMDSLNVKINGKKGFINGWNRFTESRQTWTFEFDLGGKLFVGHYNGTMTIYTPLEEGSIKLELKYSKGGVLERFLSSTSSKITIEDETTITSVENKIALGGLKSVQASFATFVAFGALFFTAIVVLIRRRRRQK